MIGLDTNAAVAVVTGRSPALIRRFRQELTRETVALPAVVLYELRYGAMKSQRRTENLERLAIFLEAPIPIWPFEAADAEAAGDIRATLERAGTPIGPHDVLIAAQARRRGAVLVTANGREFDRVRGLRTEDWTAAG